MQEVLAVRGARHRYGATVALDGVDLSVGAGECVALLGPNGAGKTTLVGLATGLLQRQEGAVALVGGDPRRARVRRALGVVQQSAGFPRTLTLRELVEGAAVRVGRPRSAAGPVLAEVGLAGLERRRLHRLSGGQEQRAKLAMALVGDPALLVLDEPTEGLDPRGRRDFWQLLAARRRAGTGILLTTHLVEECAALADRVVVLHRGRVVAAAAPDELTRRLPDRTVTVRTRLAPAVLRGLDGIRSAAVDGGVARLTTAAPEALLRDLLARDAHAAGLTVEATGLEDAVLALLDARAAEVAA